MSSFSESRKAFLKDDSDNIDKAFMPKSRVVVIDEEGNKRDPKGRLLSAYRYDELEIRPGWEKPSKSIVEELFSPKFPSTSEEYLSRKIDGGWRVIKNSVSFDLFRGYGRLIRFIPAYHDSGALFYGDYTQERDAFLERFRHLSTILFSESVESVLYVPSGGLRLLPKSLRTTRRGYKVTEYKEGLRGLLSGLLAFRDEVVEVSRQAKLQEPPNKRLSIPIILLGESERSELSKSQELNQMLAELIDNSFRARIYPVLVSDVPDGIDHEVVSDIQWATFLGAENVNYCRLVAHKGVGEDRSDVSLALIGATYSSSRKLIIPVHSRKIAESEWKKEYEKRFEEEEQAFQALLDSLDDGSI